MALEAVVFQQDPFSCSYGYGFEENKFHENWESSPSSIMMHNMKECETNSSSPEAYSTAGGFRQVEAASVVLSRRKRRRTRSFKNKEEVENQRMTHITVERNRRKQMNDYLAVLRSLMPSSYVQRGDQASIVGGAINFLKELELLVQSLEVQKRKLNQSPNPFDPMLSLSSSSIFSDFFAFPQYSTYSTCCNNSLAATESIADIEVTMVESHANLKLLTKKQPKQLLKMVVRLHSLHLTILHLNITSVDHMVLYSISLKVEEECQLSSGDDIATAVYEIVGMIQEEATFSRWKP